MSRRPLILVRPSSWIFLLSFLLVHHWYPTVAAINLDDKSLAMANRIIQKVKDNVQPDDTSSSSWSIMVQVLENSFLGVPMPENNDIYQSSPNEEEGRQRALHWLAHNDEDETLTNISHDEYDMGLLQRYALATIYFSTNGDNWDTCSQNQEKSSCENNESRYLSPHSHLKWSGINGKNGQVTWLDLTNRNLVSSNFLPYEILLLSKSLELLWLSENIQLSGSIPTYIDEFQSLVSLSIYKTNVGGTLPDSMYNLSKLTSLRLYKSNFTGVISNRIEKLGTTLKWLWIHENNFTGIVPNEIGKLVKLEGLTLHGNDFTPIIEAENKEGGGVNDNVSSSLKSNIIPDAVCKLKAVSLQHLWTDCEDDALVSQPSPVEGGGGGGGGKNNNAEEMLVIVEGKQACSCCTRCFPRKDMKIGMAAVVN